MESKKKIRAKKMEEISFKKNKENSSMNGQTRSNRSGDASHSLTPSGMFNKTGDLWCNKVGAVSLTLIGKGIKMGNVGQTPIPLGKPTNQKKRILGTNRSIADGSQRIILE